MKEQLEVTVSFSGNALTDLTKLSIATNKSHIEVIRLALGLLKTVTEINSYGSFILADKNGSLLKEILLQNAR